jgi:lipopolysaccharide export system permease protein
MRILTRHVLAQLTAAFLFSLVALTLLFVVGGAVREAVNESLPLGQVLRLIPYMLPEWLRYTVPITLLLATTSVYSRLSGSNEIVAIKALGISPMVVLWPAFLMAVVLSLVTVWLNDLAVSWGRQQAQRVIVEGVEDIAYSMLRTHKQYDSPAFSINVKEVLGRKLILPILTVKERGNTPPVIFTADEAELRLNRRQKTLEVILYNCTVDARGTVTFNSPGEYRHEFPLMEASRSAGSAAAASALSLDVIRKQIGSQTEDIVQYQRQMAALAAHEMISGDFEALAGPEWRTRRNALAGKIQQLHKLHAEPYRRWAAGFSCFCFLWVGAPMAVRRRNSDFLTSFFLCFLPILIVYYPFLIYTIDASKTGSLPPISMWSGNAVLAIWGTYLLRQVLRY